MGAKADMRIETVDIPLSKKSQTLTTKPNKAINGI